MKNKMARSFVDGKGKDYFSDTQKAVKFMKDANVKLTGKVNEILDFSGSCIKENLLDKNEVKGYIWTVPDKYTYGRVHRYWSRSTIANYSTHEVKLGGIALGVYHPSAFYVDFFECKTHFSEEEIIEFYRKCVLSFNSNSSFPHQTELSKNNIAKIFDDPTFIRSIKISPAKVINFLKNQKVKISKESANAIKGKCVGFALKDGNNRLYTMVDKLVKAD